MGRRLSVIESVLMVIGLLVLVSGFWSVVMRAVFSVAAIAGGSAALILGLGLIIWGRHHPSVVRAGIAILVIGVLAPIFLPTLLHAVVVLIIVSLVAVGVVSLWHRGHSGPSGHMRLGGRR